MSILAVLRRIRCRLNLHPRLDVIQTFGAAQHIGCPYCRREFGIHHGERVVVPWDSDLAEMYDFLGYKTAESTRRWRRSTP